MDQCPKHKEAI
jgi:hypothetical protein